VIVEEELDGDHEPTKSSKYDRVAQVLKDEIGLTDSKKVDIIVKGAPSMQTITYSNLQGKIQFLRETFDFSNKELQKLIIGCPTLLTIDGNRTLLPKVTYLLELFDGDKKTVCSLVLRFPNLFCY
jgi:hypothetical protein